MSNCLRFTTFLMNRCLYETIIHTEDSQSSAPGPILFLMFNNQSQENTAEQSGVDVDVPRIESLNLR